MNTDQKESLLKVIKSFLPATKKEDHVKYTSGELASFYERRDATLAEDGQTYSVEESHTRIRKARVNK